uniref:response regulator transcription factor n=1 Tax=uncultured Sphingomonas sp. TaxID=158754 RepID=UPI0035CC092E
MRTVYMVSPSEALVKTFGEIISARPDLSMRVFASFDRFVAAFSTLSPSIIFLDVDKLGQIGVAAITRMISEAPGFRIIALTGTPDVRQMFELVQAGAVDLVGLPYSADVLLTAIDTGLTRLSENFEDIASTLEARRIIATLSRREGQIFTQMLEGHANKVSAFALDLSVRTVEIYRSHVMSKLGVRSIAEACGIAFQAGLFPKPSRSHPEPLATLN